MIKIEFDIIPLIANGLKPISNRGITVVNGWYDKDINDTHITFLVINEFPNAITDDEIELMSYLIQVDIWSKNDEWKLKNEVIRLMSALDFGYIDGKPFYETETGIYHNALRFKYIQEVE